MGLGSEEYEVINKLLREHKLAPPLNAEIIKGNHIGVLGVKVMSSAFQVVESSCNRGEDNQTENWWILTRCAEEIRNQIGRYLICNSEGWEIRATTTTVAFPTAKPSQQLKHHHQQQEQ